MYKISIIGSGMVGGAIGKVFTKYGYHVIFYDLERERLKELASRGYKVAETLEEAVLNTDISFICVPTPSNNGSPQKSEICDYFDFRLLELYIYMYIMYNYLEKSYIPLHYQMK
jgi:Predicted UDP-glucose 6-dehydrogenase